MDPLGLAYVGKGYGGKGSGGNQTVDRAATELDAMVQGATRLLDRGVHMKKRRGIIYQSWVNNKYISSWLKTVARVYAIQQITDKLPANNRYLEGIVKNRTGAW